MTKCKECGVEGSWFCESCRNMSRLNAMIDFDRRAVEQAKKDGVALPPIYGKLAKETQEEIERIEDD